MGGGCIDGEIFSVGMFGVVGEGALSFAEGDRDGALGSTFGTKSHAVWFPC